MWIFTPGGLLMPAALPSLEKDKVEVDPVLTNNGEFDIQVRARVESHLQNFIDEYVEPQGFPRSVIQATPTMDYNFRFYMRKDQFAKAMMRAIEDIDYQKFKPTAHQAKYGKDGEKYHSVLNAIWGTVTRLGNPGYPSWGAPAAKGWDYLAEHPEDNSATRKGDGWDLADDGTPGHGWDRTELDEDPTTEEDDLAALDDLRLLKGTPVAEWTRWIEPDQVSNIRRLLEEYGLRVKQARRRVSKKTS